MKTKDNIQILREDVNLAEAVRRDTDLLPTLPTDLNERVIRQMAAAAANNQAARKKVWLCTAVLSAVAASIVLLLMLKTPASEEPENSASERRPYVASVPKSNPESLNTTDSLPVAPPLEPQELAKERIRPLLAAEDVPKPAERIISPSGAPKTKKGLRTSTALNKEQTKTMEAPAPEVADHSSEEYADTLGNSIFESSENVLLAVEMLTECEAVIRQETQRVRNNLIEATFEVLPPSKEAILVKEENGDLNLMDTRRPRIIEL